MLNQMHKQDATTEKEVVLPPNILEAMDNALGVGVIEVGDLPEPVVDEEDEFSTYAN